MVVCPLQKRLDNVEIWKGSQSQDESDGIDVDIDDMIFPILRKPLLIACIAAIIDKRDNA